MKCEKCGKNEATTYYRETVNGQTREIRLCADCAGEMGIGQEFQQAFTQMQESFFSDPFPVFSASGFTPLLSGMLGGAGAPAGLADTGKRCPSCGMTQRELRRTGRAGCPDCYHAFAEILSPYIRQVQGADAHIGSAPKAQGETPAEPTQDLRDKLRAAVESENYEEAARLRDEIKRLEGEGK